jgi:hypothetical protein
MFRHASSFLPRSGAFRAYSPGSPGHQLYYNRSAVFPHGNAAETRERKHARMTNTNTQLLADIRQLAPQFAARAAEFEAQRRIPPDVVEIFRSIGIFRMFVPRSLDGMELDLPSGLEVISALARIGLVAGASPDAGRSPAVANMRTGCSPSASHDGGR